MSKMFDGYAPEFRAEREAVMDRLATHGAAELAARISFVLDVQDSCRACWIVTMREALITGEPGMWMCEKCEKEYGEQV